MALRAVAEDMPIGDMLRVARGNRSLREAARILGVDTTNYRLWEQGVRRPKAERADELATFLGVSKTAVLRSLNVLSLDEEILKLGGRDSNPQPTDYPIAA